MHYFVITFDGTEVKFYQDGVLVNNKTVDMTFKNINEVDIGWNASAKFFKGVIDEVKIYNRTLSYYEILRNYYNYGSFSKGCCNYLSMINPNSMGYNDSAYKKNISYSSKLFYRYKDVNLVPDIILYNVTNLTSQDTQVPFYNLMFDKCLADAYDIFSYEDDDGNMHVDVVDVNATKGVDCKDLARDGFY